MAKVMVTGGAGFIGSFVVKDLLKQGHDVLIYDSFIQYVSPLDSLYQFYLKERLKDIRTKVLIERGDTRDKGHVARFVAEHKPQRIIHLAALPIADLSNSNPEEALNTILLGTVNVLEAIRDIGGVERFVYASSSMVYGDFHYEPVSESHPKNPKDIYGGTKMAGETLVQVYGRRFGIEYAIVRPSAVYGPTDANQRVVQVFVENAFRGEELVLRGGSEERLDFTYVEDIASGFVKATFVPGAKNEIFNITCGKAKSLTDLAMILQAYFPNLTITEAPRSSFRPRRGALNIKKAKRLLKYKPIYTLEKGIKKYIEFIQSSGAYEVITSDFPNAQKPIAISRRKRSVRKK